MNAAFSVSTLTTDAAWGGSVHVSSPLTITDGLSMNSGTFGGNGAMALAGTSTWSNGTVTVGTGGLNLTGTLTLTNSASVIVNGGGTVTNQGEIKEMGAGSLLIGDGTTLNNEPGAFYRFQSDAGLGATFGSGTFNNRGTLSKDDGTGTSFIGTNTTSFGIAFNTSGLINVDTGRIQMTEGQVGTGTGGTFTVAAGATLDLTGGSIVSYQGTYTGSGDGQVLINPAGTLRLAGDTTFEFPQGLLQWQGDIDLNGHTLTNAADGFLAQSGSSASRAFLSDNATGGILDNQGEIDQTGTGDLVFRDGTTLRNEPGAVYRLLTDSGFVPQGGLAGGGSFLNLGTLSKDGSTGGRSAIDFDVGFDNPGTVEVHQGTLLVGRAPNQVSGNTLTGGTWEVFDPATLTISVPDTLNTNNATIVLDGPNAVFTNIAGLSSNGGSLGLLDGRAFTTAGNFTNNGTLFIDGASTFTVAGSLTNFANGTLTGGTWLIAGTLVFPSADIVTDAANLVLDGSGPGQILDPAGNNGLANLAVIDAAGALTLQNGYVLTTGGSLTNFGYLLLDATSQLSVSGDYTQDAAATLEIQLDGIAGTAGQLNISGAAGLDGTLTLTPVNGYVPATGDTFTVLTFATRNGTDFANPPAGFDESFDDDNGVLTVIAQ